MGLGCLWLDAQAPSQMLLRAEKRASPDTATGAAEFIFSRAATESLPYRFGWGICSIQFTPRFPLSKLKPHAHRIKQHDPRHFENKCAKASQGPALPLG